MSAAIDREAFADHGADTAVAKIKAARDWLDSEEAKVGTWWSPILRKQSIRTRFINRVDSAVDAYLAAEPVTEDEGALPGCTGTDACPAPAHQHGCFADMLGHCNEPEAHPTQPATGAVEWGVRFAVSDRGMSDESSARETVNEGAEYGRKLIRRTVTEWQEAT